MFNFTNGDMHLTLIGLDKDYALFHRTDTDTYIIGWLPTFIDNTVSWTNGTYLSESVTRSEAFDIFHAKFI